MRKFFSTQLIVMVIIKVIYICMFLGILHFGFIYFTDGNGFKYIKKIYKRMFKTQYYKDEFVTGNIHKKDLQKMLSKDSSEKTYKKYYLKD